MPGRSCNDIKSHLDDLNYNKQLIVLRIIPKSAKRRKIRKNLESYKIIISNSYWIIMIFLSFITFWTKVMKNNQPAAEEVKINGGD